MGRSIPAGIYYMKKRMLLLCLIYSLIGRPTHAQSNPPLSVRVIVTLREQADLSRIPDGDPILRRRQIVAALKATAGAAQAKAGAIVMRAAVDEPVTDITPFWIFNGFAITASPEVIARLAVSPDVLRVTSDDVAIAPAGVVTASADVEANLAIVNAPALWSLGWRGQGIVVANLDTGVDLTHPDLAASWRGGTNSWFDPFGQHPVTPSDVNGHGTSTMGVMVGGSAGGTAIGVAPDAKWIAAKVFDDRSRSSATAVHQAYQWLLDPDGNPATDDAPDVVNNSWTFTSSGCELEFELDLQALRAAGILPIFAAGNSGPEPATSLSPGNNPSAFAVGATDDNDQTYSGSSRGPSACGNSLFPHISAPGVDIRSSSTYGQYYDSTGTSLAAPHVAGVLATLLSAYPDLTVSQQQAALVAGARDLGAARADNVFGAGRLDGLAAYDRLGHNGFTPQGRLPVPIYAIQGTGHISPLDGQFVTTEGIVTARNDDGFYIQAAAADTDEATSEAIFVAAGQLIRVTVGDSVRVAAHVVETQANGSSGNGLTITHLVNPAVTVLSSGNPLPAPTILGAVGRVMPTGVIEDDGLSLFDPQDDGLDFFESLEAMRVQVNDALVVGATDADGAMWVLADGGAAASQRSARGGIMETIGDANPERIRLGGTLYPVAGNLPALDVGARITELVVGVLDYRAANYELLVTGPFAADTSAQVTRESTALAHDGTHLLIAAYDGGGLGGDAGAADFAFHARQIVNNLAAPDIMLLEGILDDSGAADEGTTTAAATFARLIAAVQTAGGPAYRFVQIDPVDNRDGGAGSNPRLGLLYNPARVVLDGAPGSVDMSAGIACLHGKAAITRNPGLIAPIDAVWEGNRKPLAAQIEFNGQSLLMVGIDLASQAADSPLYGAAQPPPKPSRDQRYAQAFTVADFVRLILACEPAANVLILGNGNDALEAPSLAPLHDGGMQALDNLLPSVERYTSVIEGNSRSLQHAFASPALFAAEPSYDVVHLNAEFAARRGDHDPVLARFKVQTQQGSPPRAYLAYIGR